MRQVKATVDTQTPIKKDIKAVQAMIIIKKTFKDVIGLENDPIIPDMDHRIMCLGNVGLWVEVIGLHNKYIIEIKEITIDEELRGRGIGKSILYTILRVCDEMNVKVGLWVKKDNKKSLEWYKKMGLKPKARGRNGDIWLECTKFKFDYFKGK